MLKYLLISFSFSFSLIVFCQSTNYDSWYGEYYFLEKPEKTNNGDVEALTWRLVVYPGEGNESERGILEVKGEKAELKFNVYIEGYSGNFLVRFSDAVTQSDHGFKKGDILFSLQVKKEGVITTWGAMSTTSSPDYNGEYDEYFIKIESASD